MIAAFFSFFRKGKNKKRKRKKVEEGEGRKKERLCYFNYGKIWSIRLNLIFTLNEGMQVLRMYFKGHFFHLTGG